MKRIRTALALSIALTCLSTSVYAQVTAETKASVSGTAQWDTFVAMRPELQAPPTNLSRLVFFRPFTSPQPEVSADIFVNDRFHAALLPGGYAQLTVCPGTVRIDLRGHATSGKASIHAPTELTARGGQTHLIETHNKQLASPFRQVMASQVANELGRLQQQAHAISRQPSADNCPPVVVATAPVPPPVVAPPRQPQKYTLSSELLFRFSGSKVQDLSSIGQSEVVKLARSIREQHARIDHVAVLGHTDPMGSKELNQRLSLERAQTIRQILVDSGLPAQIVTAQGFADNQLVVNNCNAQARKREEMLACNQPNRRVEILVSGEVK